MDEAYQGENREVLLSNGVSFAFHAAVKPNYVRRNKRVNTNPQTPKIDKQTYYKAFALPIREYMRGNNLFQRECAAALGMSPARVSQLLRHNS